METRVLYSYLLRLLRTLSVTTAFCFVLLAGSFYFQYMMTAVMISFAFAILSTIITLVLHVVIKKKDPELTTDVGKLLFPSEGVLSLALCALFGSYFITQIPNPGYQYVVFILAGLGILIFRLIRCFDLKFLRKESELRPH